MQKPQYQLVQGSGKGRECLCRAVLETKKKTRLIFTSGIAAIDRPAAEQYAALCALYNVLPAAPREKLLPEPYRAAWLNFKAHPPPVRPRPPPVAQQRLHDGICFGAWPMVHAMVHRTPHTAAIRLAQPGARCG
jgi:hypothetical protein